MVRSVDHLRRDQAEVMRSFRTVGADRPGVAVLPRSGGPTGITVYGRVDSVVTSDPVHGPHLLVIRQQWLGTPPVVSDAGGSVLRCYPSPNHSVQDYALNDYVRITITHGATVADRLA